MRTLPKTAGVTLLELMVTISIGAILLTQAVPSFQATIKNNQMVAGINEFTSAINLARSEAVKRRSPVTVCVQQSATQCDSTNDTWESGWLVFVDNNGDGNIDTAQGDTVLRQHAALAENTTLRSTTSSTNKRISFDTRGRILNGNGSFSMMLCDERGAGHGRALSINGAGFVRLASDDDGDGIVNVSGTAEGELTCLSAG